MTFFQGIIFYLRKQKEVRWGQVGTVWRLWNRCNPDPDQVVAHDKGGMNGSIVMVKLPRILDLTPDADDSLFKSFEDVHGKPGVDDLPLWYKLGMEYIATSASLLHTDSLYCTPSRSRFATRYNPLWGERSASDTRA